jgi:hypothetical protein
MLVTFNSELVDMSSPDRATLAGITIESPGISDKLRALLQAETTRIFQKHGAAAFGSPKQSAAIHEAGHTVIAAYIGRRPKRVRIKQSEADMWLGLTECYERPRLDTPAKLLREARFIYAGVAAEMMFDPNFREASSLDEVIMSQLVADQAAQELGTDPETYWRSAVHEVTGQWLKQHQTTVIAVAESLFRHHTLKRPHLTKLIAAVKSEATSKQPAGQPSS